MSQLARFFLGRAHFFPKWGRFTCFFGAPWRHQEPTEGQKTDGGNDYALALNEAKDSSARGVCDDPLAIQHSCGKSSSLMGKSTISMVIFKSYVKLPEVKLVMFRGSWVIAASHVRFLHWSICLWVSGSKIQPLAGL